MNTHDTPVQFPEIPKDNLTLGILDGFKRLSQRLVNEHQANNYELNQIASYLFCAVDSPIEMPFVYFTLYQGMHEDCAKLTDFYNHYIHSRGMEYGLEVINREVGDFAEYFNDFQLLMHSFLELSRNKPEYEPLSTLIWGLYCSLYDKKKRTKFLAKSMEWMKGNFSEQ